MIRNSTAADQRIPTTSNALILAAQLVALGVCFGLAARVHGFGPLAALAIGFAILMNSVYSIIHEAEHAMLFPNRKLNDWAGIVMALFFPAPFHLLRQGHIGHHLRNRSDDEAFDLYFEGDNPLWRWMVWIGILTGMYYLLVVLSNIIAAALPFVLDRRHFTIERHVKLDRPGAAFLESFNAAHLRWIRFEGIAVITLHAAILCLLHVPWLTYLAIYGTFGFSWSAMQYVHHYATERHVTRGARNLRLFAPIDAIWLNHNWHRVHHEHPTVPWVYLPRLAPESQERRGFLPLAYLRMWHGPRRTDQHIENKYAGRIIQ